MNKTLPIIGLVIVVLIGFGAYFFIANQSKTPQNTQTLEEGREASRNSLRSLLSGGKSQLCTYNSDGIEGKVYISDKRMRGDFTTNVDTKRVSHIVVDGDTMFTWSDGEKTGFKLTFDADDLEGDASDSANSSVDLDAEFDYKCVAWAVDNTIFTPPSSVTFTSFSGPSTPAANCSVCNNLQGEPKTQCLKALKC